MNIEEVYDALRKGQRVRRQSWDVGSFVQETTLGDVTYPSVFDETGRMGGYLWNEDDTAATDWEVVARG